MFLYHIHALMQKFHILISGGSRPWAKRGFLSLALLAFLPSVIFFFTQNMGGGGRGGALGPPSPSPSSTTVNHSDILINHSTTRACPLFSTRGGLYQPLIDLEKKYSCFIGKAKTFPNHNISIQVLHTVPFTCPEVFTRRICLTIKSFFSFQQFPLFFLP